jgi:hypothetical protein
MRYFRYLDKGHVVCNEVMNARRKTQMTLPEFLFIAILGAIAMLGFFSMAEYLAR